ncbi:MAG: PilZ domain-containing protein [Planctomycetaceae bacterium]
MSSLQTLDVRRLRQVLEGDQRQSATQRERRADERIPYRSLVTTFVEDQVTHQLKPQMVPAWSLDVSSSGAAIVTSAPIKESRLFLRFLLPWAGTECLQSEVVNETAMDEFLGERGKFYRYGLRFIRLLTEAELAAALESINPATE